ncbi:hypothetical protein V6N13_135197 [Hibiscus sabdariffa]
MEEGNSQFPAPVKVASGSSKEDGKAEWKLFDTALDFFPPVAQEGKLLVQPSRDVLDVGAQQWSNALVGTFLGKSLILSVFQKTADKLWGREGSVEIRFLAPSVYMVNFPSQRVRDWVLESRPCHIQQKVIVLRKWSPRLNLDVLTLDSAPVWVRLWHIPLELYSQKGLGYLASAIVDLGDGLTVSVGVELDWSPPRCHCCSVFGHLEENCPNKKVSASDLIIGEGGPEVGVESVSAMLTSGIGSLIVDGGVGSTVGAPEIAYGDGSLKGDGFVDSSVGAPEIVSGDGNLEVDGITISVADIASGKRGAVHVGVGASDGGNYISEDGDKLSIVVSPNRFDNLSSIEVDHVVSPRKERLAAAGVGDLLNQLKAKGKGGGPKNNKKGRGFNDPLKQLQVLKVVRKLDIQVLCLLETRVKESNASVIVGKCFMGWNFVHNYSDALNGRIWVLYKDGWGLDVISKSAQSINCCLQKGGYCFHVSFVYGHNGREERLALWEELVGFKLELENIQKLLLVSPSGEMIAREKQAAMDLKALIMAEESFFRQKSRVQFVKEGDQNTSFFFRKVQIQQKANTISSLYNSEGVKLESFGDISSEFVKYFSDSLGSVNDSVDTFSDDLLKQILGVKLSAEIRDALVAPITHKEIKDVLFSMNGNVRIEYECREE